MKAIIAYRVNGGPVEMVLEEAGDVAVFGSVERAELYAGSNKLFESGQGVYQVLELDQLDGARMLGCE